MNARTHMLLILAALVGTTGCLYESTLTIKPDGTCLIRTEMSGSRSAAERLFGEAFGHRGKEDAKPLKDMTDAELADVIRKRLPVHQPEAERINLKLETVEVKDGKVRIVVTMTLDSVKALVTHSRMLAQVLLGTRRLIIAKNAKEHLQIEQHGHLPDDEEEVAEGLARFAPQGMKLVYRMVLPGKVLTSTLPKTKDKATWITVDIADPEKGAKQLAAAFAKPIVITSELGGLKLEGRLDSDELARHVRPGTGGWDDVPVTPAVPGFVVTPISVTTVGYGLLRGRAGLEEKHMTALRNSSGVTLHCELTLPKGCHLISQESHRVVEAVDAKGRAIPLESPLQATRHYSSHRDRADDPIPLEFRMRLPARDARTVGRLRGDVILLTNSKWKTLTIPGAKADPEKKIDMSAVLPGAVGMIRKVDRGSVDLQIKGKEKAWLVDHLRYALKFADGREFEARRQGHSMSSGPEHFDATLNLASDELRREQQAPPGGVTLIIRAPDDVRRQKVTFTLQNLPLIEPKAGEAEF